MPKLQYQLAGANVQFVTYPGIGHVINEQIVSDVSAFFQKAIKR